MRTLQRAFGALIFVAGLWAALQLGRGPWLGL